jgi:hypothetical protein
MYNMQFTARSFFFRSISCTDIRRTAMLRRRQDLSAPHGLSNLAFLLRVLAMLGPLMGRMGSLVVGTLLWLTCGVLKFGV